MKNKILVILLTILVLASFLRLWKLGEVPISPDWDEVSLGYNAYSIMQTGRDEYGTFLPVVLRSYDDYKPALYSYLAISSIKSFGLNTWAVRLPSAIFGILTVLAIFFLVKELFKRNDIALVSSFLLAVSPWHIQFSRVAFESNVGLAFNVFAILFLLKSLNRNIFIFLSVIFAALSLYVYQSEKVFIPLIFLAIILIYRKEFLSKPKKILAGAVILGLVISLPMLSFLVSNKNSLERARGVSIFSEPISASLAQRSLNDNQRNDFLGKLFDNRRVFFAKSIISGYLSHYDLNWLFIRGDLGRHHAPNMALLYLFELPFVLIGIYKLSQYKDKKIKWVIISWFLIAPIPASITSGVPHAVRTLNFLPTFQIFSALGILSFLTFARNFKNYVLIILPILFIFNFIYFLDQYFVQQNFYTAKDWQYGYKETIGELSKIQDKYEKIVVSNQPPMDQSYMFFLFYLRYDPLTYQRVGQYASGGFRENHKFDKFEFRPINWAQELKDGKTLFIGREGDIQGGQELFRVYYPDETVAMKIAK